MKTINDILKEFEKRFVARGYNVEMTAFLRSAIETAFKETSIVKARRTYNGSDLVSKRIYQAEADGYNIALRRVKYHQQKFLK